MPAPIACRPEAYEYFAAQVPQLESNRGLLHAAIGISLHALPHIPAAAIEDAIDGLVGRIRRRVRGAHRQALLAHMHDELFEVQRYRGNVKDYHNPNNSFLPMVLETGRGNPITLALIYRTIALRLGLRAEGINAPGHFLVQVAGGGRPMLVDPFHGGKVLTRAEAFDQIDKIIGRPIERSDENLRPATHRQWLARMLGNLVRIYAATGDQQELAAMTELAQLLGNFPE
jgi:regulator of sirC expression with transglutaminase-like and TPR domain